MTAKSSLPPGTTLIRPLSIAKHFFERLECFFVPILSGGRAGPYPEAAPAGNGSDTDGVAVKAVGLPMSVMSLHVHLFASDHSEMASYINRCLSCFFALFARTLIKLDRNGDF